MPVAANCRVDPTNTPCDEGVTEMDESSAVTVSVLELLTDPEVAIMLACPPFNPEAKPEPLIEATLGADEVQITLEVRSFVVPSA